jgi:hypothetical protein
MLQRKTNAKEFAKKMFNFFDIVRMAHYLEVYIGSSEIDCAFFLKLDE